MIAILLKVHKIYNIYITPSTHSGHVLRHNVEKGCTCRLCRHYNIFVGLKIYYFNVTLFHYSINIHHCMTNYKQFSFVLYKKKETQRLMNDYNF